MTSTKGLPVRLPRKRPRSVTVPPPTAIMPSISAVISSSAVPTVRSSLTSGALPPNSRTVRLQPRSVRRRLSGAFMASQVWASHSSRARLPPRSCSIPAAGSERHMSQSIRRIGTLWARPQAQGMGLERYWSNELIELLASVQFSLAMAVLPGRDAHQPAEAFGVVALIHKAHHTGHVRQGNTAV